MEGRGGITGVDMFVGFMCVEVILYGPFSRQQLPDLARTRVRGGIICVHTLIIVNPVISLNRARSRWL